MASNIPQVKVQIHPIPGLWESGHTYLSTHYFHREPYSPNTWNYLQVTEPAVTHTLPSSKVRSV